ncbi:MAG: DNA polymerase I, partial [Oscillospiraceae bacterium]|nr:DNA polymerase I [Oscillospiraceae bacterium]
NRAFYGVRTLTTREGLFTNGIYGFLNILEKVRSEEKPDALCVAFDLHGPTFRHLQYEGYKATRHGMPEELAMQMPVMKEVLSAMNIPIYECQGWEADDVIGTVSRICSDNGCECVILTGDRDSLQLVDDRVTVKLVRSQGGQTLTQNYTPEVFWEEYGMEPIRLIDLKALMGDSSDNIPGVAGVGPKTATDLLKKYETLDGVYENLTPQNMKGKLFEKLTNGKESAYLSYDLATIRRDAPITFAPEDCLIREPKRKELYDLFMKLEFQKLIDRYKLRSAAFEVAPSKTEECVVLGECNSTVVRDAAHAAELLPLFKSQSHVVYHRNEEGFVIYVPATDAMMYYYEKATLGEAYREIVGQLMTKEISKIGHDVKPLMRELLEAGLTAHGFVFDTAVASYLLDTGHGNHDLPTVAMEYLGFTPAQETATGALFSAAATVEALYQPLTEKLREKGLEKLYYDIDFPLCYVLANMEADGVRVDQEALAAYGAMLRSRIAECEEVIFSYSGGPFNINSTKQLGELLFEKLGLPPVKKTKSGYSTNVEVLQKLEDKHPIVPAIMEYRELTKLNSTYAEGLQKTIAPDGRIHTTFKNLLTATGRLSSTEPNLQNIPVRKTLGSEIRKMFVPREGWVFVDADYSQIELRVLAHIAQDKAMENAFRSGQDFHRVTASQVFNVPVEEVTSQMRSNAKAVNFGIVYGISEFSLSQDIGVSRYEAKAYIDSYLSKYPGVRDYMRDIVETARKQGYVTTAFGRRRYLPEITSTNFNIRSGAERIALNTPIQGTAADIIKLAMVRVFQALEKDGLQARLILTVHDELIIECPMYEAYMVMDMITREMEQAVKLSVPLVAEAKMGESWFDAK